MRVMSVAMSIPKSFLLWTGLRSGAGLGDRVLANTSTLEV